MGDVRRRAQSFTGYLFLFGAWRNRVAHLQARGACADAGRSPRAARGGRAPAAATDDLLEMSVLSPVERAAGSGKDGEGWVLAARHAFVVKRSDLKVERGRTYHMAVTKQGGRIRWRSTASSAGDDRSCAALRQGKRRFGFSSWANDTYFDNLRIRRSEFLDQPRGLQLPDPARPARRLTSPALLGARSCSPARRDLLFQLVVVHLPRSTGQPRLCQPLPIHRQRLERITSTAMSRAPRPRLDCRAPRPAMCGPHPIRRSEGGERRRKHRRQHDLQLALPGDPDEQADAPGHRGHRTQACLRPRRGARRGPEERGHQRRRCPGLGDRAETACRASRRSPPGCLPARDDPRRAARRR